MTAPTMEKEFVVEELLPGQYLAEARETWSRYSVQDKWRLGLLIGFDQVLRIERRYQQYS